MSTYTKQIIIDNEGEEARFYSVERTDEDDRYEKNRNHLILTAEGFANREHGVVAPEFNDRAAWCDVWTRCFLQKMNELCKEKGI